MAAGLRGCCYTTCSLSGTTHHGRCQHVISHRYPWLAADSFNRRSEASQLSGGPRGRKQERTWRLASASSDPTDFRPVEPAVASPEDTQVTATNATPSPQRARLTFEQMQREARAKLGDRVRQQLEADRQQQQQAAMAPVPSATTPSTTSFPSSRTASPRPQSVTPRGPAAAPQQAAARISPDAPAAAAAADAAVAAPPQLPLATVAETPSHEWEAMRQEWEEEWQRIRVRWRQFVEHPLEPPPQQQQPDGPPAGAAAAVTAASASAAAAEGGSDVKRRAFVSRALQLACVAVFVAQWAPVMQALGGGVTAAATAGREVWLALLVASPPTPLTLSWQADTISLSTGQFGCLLTSSCLHSGLVSLLVSMASLEETLPWLETLDGFVIMLLSYGMAGVTAGLTQMLLGGQSTGIAGLAAAVGMEVAVAVRCWRYTGGQLLPPTPAFIALAVVASIMAAYQPLVGMWGILGGILGGALSAVLAYDILYLMRIILAVAILLGLGAWNLLGWLPRVLWRVVVGVVAVVWATAVAVVQTLRGV